MQINEQKIAEIKKQLRNGRPEGEIKEELRKEGYSDADMKAAFIPHQYDMRLWYLIFGILVSIFSIYNFLMGGGFLLLLLGPALFYAYYRENKRLAK